MRLSIVLILSLLGCSAALPNDLPETPKPKFDKRVFVTAVSLLAASQTADAVTTRINLNNGGWENNPIYGRHPSAAKQSGMNTLAFLGDTSLFYLAEKNNHAWVRWTGRAYMGLVIADHIHLASCNSGINVHSLTAHNCHSALPF